jgi:hypothetical protein
MLDALNDPRILQILSPDGDPAPWREDLERFLGGDETLTRRSAGEGGIRALQRLLVFLGYSTAASGACLVDGDFGRGTNRGVAQFQFERGLTGTVDRQTLCYPCSVQNARLRIGAIPDVELDVDTLEAMLETALAAIEAGKLTFGRFDDALFHLNALHARRLLTCRQILERYGENVRAAIQRIRHEHDVAIQSAWVLAIIKQETGGVVRPRFEQHKLSRLNLDHPQEDLAELRHQSMSIGLGQIMGFNSQRVGASSARAMLNSPAEEQVLYVARFLLPKRSQVGKGRPDEADFRSVARFYNGPSYESHFYHEGLARWFREFRALEERTDG